MTDLTQNVQSKAHRALRRHFLFNLHALLRIAMKHGVSAPKSKPLKYLSLYLFGRTSSDQLFAADLYSMPLPGSSAAVRRCVELHMVLMSGGTHSPSLLGVLHPLHSHSLAPTHRRSHQHIRKP